MSETAVAPEDLRKGAQNLLLGCVGVAPGDQVLIVREDPGPGYYDAAAGDAVEAEAERLGARVHSLWTAAPLDGPEDFPKVVAAATKVTPMNAHAGKAVDKWDVYAGPTPGFTEEVYLLEVAARPNGKTTALLHNKEGDLGTTVTWSVKELPYLTIWKNTAALPRVTTP